MTNPVQAEKVRIILKFVSYTLATGFFGSLALAALALQTAAPHYPVIACWFGFSTLNFLARYLALLKIIYPTPADRAMLRSRAWLHTLLSGCIWGTAAWLFMPTMPAPYQAAFVVILLGLNATSVPLMSSTLGVSSIFLPTWLPVAYVFYAADGSLAMALAVCFMLACVYLVAFIIRNTLDDFISVKLERDDAVKELRSAIAMQMSFFLAASHDFRQPLQSMSFYVMSLKKRMMHQGSEIVGVLEKLQGTFEKLEHLIDETIGFAKISMGIEPPSVEAMPVQDLVEPLLANFRDSAEANGLRFRIYYRRNCVLQTNTQILKRILDNLVSNAVQHTVQGGVLVAFRQQGTDCSIQVWDTGCGIPEVEQERVFDAFYQGTRGKRESHQGYGLGLMIVKRLSERIGADLSFSSRVGKGTVFRLTLPKAPSAVANAAIAARSRPYVLPKRYAKVAQEVRLDTHTIAIVDDDPGIRESLESILCGAGATVIAAAHREELLHALANVHQLSLLLTDLHLTNVLGDNIAAEIQARYPASRVLILTGDASAETQARLTAKGFVVLLKPTSADVLLAKIASLLDMPPEAHRLFNQE